MVALVGVGLIVANFQFLNFKGNTGSPVKEFSKRKKSQFQKGWGGGGGGDDGSHS